MIEKVLIEAAKKAVKAWKRSDENADDLVNDLWVWYLSSPSIKVKMESIKEYEAVSLAKRAAIQILSKKVLDGNLFNGRNMYSVNNIKEALAGKTTNEYLIDILPIAFNALSNNSESQAEAIRSRYSDGVVPTEEGGAAMKLSRAVKSLTDQVNIIAITAGVDADGNAKEGPGSRHAVFPGTRRGTTSAGYSDPTANMAMALIKAKEDLREDYLYETPLREFLRGRSS